MGRLALSIFVLIVLSKLFIPTNSIDTKLNLELMKDLLLYSLDKTLYPRTIRVISYESFQDVHQPNFTYQDILPDNVPVLVGDVKPHVQSPDPRVIATGRLTGFTEKYHYTVIIYIPDLSSLPQMRANVELTVNQRFDRVLIITQKASDLPTLMTEPLLVRLKDKIFLSLSTPDSAWVDPFVYNGGHLIPIRSLDQIPNRGMMGGNLHGRHLRVAGAEFKPWVYPIDDGKGWYTFHGSNVKLIHLASLAYNYTYSFPTYDLSYGDYWAKNASWTGMYSHIFYPDGGADLTTFLGYDLGWSYGVDYPSIFSTCGIVFYTNQPRYELKWYAFILPFEPVVWIGAIVSYIILGIVQFIVMYLLHNRKYKYIVYDSAYFLPYAMAMEQGLCEIPKGARYLCLVWLLGCTVLGTGYRATLRKNLSFPRPEPVPLTYEELAARPEFTIILNKMGSLEVEYFKESTSAAMKNIQSRLTIDEDAERSIRNVYMARHAAVIGWSSAMMQEMAKHLTVNSRVDPLVMSKGTPKVNTMSMGFQKHSIFVDSFFGITGASDVSGLMMLWEAEENLKFKKQGMEKLSTQKDTDLYKMLIDQTKQTDADRKPLTMENLFAVFMFLPIGIVISGVFFILEGFYFARDVGYGSLGVKSGYIFHAYGWYVKRRKVFFAWVVKTCVDFLHKYGHYHRSHHKNDAIPPVKATESAKSGQSRKSIELQEKAKRQSLMGEEHVDPKSVEMLQAMAVGLFELGRFSEARPIFEKIIAQENKLFGENCAQATVTMSWLASTQFHLGQVREAKNTLYNVHANQVKHFGARSAAARETEQRIIDMLGTKDLYTDTELTVISEEEN